MSDGIVARTLGLVKAGICWSNALETARVETESGAPIADRTLELMRGGAKWSEALAQARQEATGATEMSGAGDDDPDCWVGM